jgi:hypothetical protein
MPLQPPIKLDLFTRLLDIHFPSSGPLLLIQALLAGEGTPGSPVTWNAPFPGGAAVNIMKAPQQYAVNQVFIPIQLMPNSAMRKGLYAWAPGWTQTILAPATSILSPQFSQIGNFLINYKLIRQKFGLSVPGFEMKLKVPQVGAFPGLPNASTKYIVFLGNPGQAFAGGQYWFAVYSDNPLDNFPNIPFATILNNYGGSVILEYLNGTIIPAPPIPPTVGDVLFAFGDGSVALNCATYITANSKYQNSLGGFGGNPTVSVDFWNVSQPLPPSYAIQTISAGLFSTKSKQTFNQSYLQGSDTFQWYSPPPPPLTGAHNPLNVAPNGPVQTRVFNNPLVAGAPATSVTLDIKITFGKAADGSQDTFTMTS